MTDYRGIPDSEIESEKPVTNTLLTALRDNTTAITEGSAGAPKIQSSALDSNSVTSSKINDGAVTNSKVNDGALGAEKFQSGTTEGDWVRARLGGGLTFSAGSEITLYRRDDEIISSENVANGKFGDAFLSLGSGTISFSYDLRTSSASGRNAQANIYVDGLLVDSQLRSTNTYETKTGTFSVKFGQVVDFRFGDDGGLANNGITQNVIFTADY